MKKILALTLATALSLPLHASTYDDLIHGAMLGSTGDIRSLLQRGASVDTTDAQGNTLLMLAARDGHNELLRLLIEHRAKLNARNAPVTLRWRWPHFVATWKAYVFCLMQVQRRPSRVGRRWFIRHSPVTKRLPSYFWRAGPTSMPAPTMA